MPTRLPSEEDLAALPPTLDPYTTLSVPRTATPAEIKTSYRRLALSQHPDKSPLPAAEATAQFQALTLAYAVLSDPSRRARYDATGRTTDSLADDDGAFDWADFYGARFADAVSADAIEAVRAEYQGGEEERADVLGAYTASKGDMDGVFERVMCSDVGRDEERFRVMILEGIEAGEVKAYKKFGGEGEKGRERRRRKAEVEAREAEEAAEELGVKEKLWGKKKGGDGEDGLKALIMQRQKGRQEGFLEALEAKYAPKKAKGKKRGGDDEPSEEMFEKNRKRGKARQ